jgi:7-cyano-7-deazaguanine synthase
VTHKSHALVLLSGGLDSAVCLYLAKSRHEHVTGITFNYFERRIIEREATEKLASRAGVDLIQLGVEFLREASDIKKASTRLKGVNQVYIPARNIIFYGVAAHFAERLGATYIYGGHLKTDSLRFKDASKRFFNSLNNLFLNHLSTGAVRVVTPLITLEKHEVVQLGSSLGVPFELTWSCYEDGPRPCRKCEACREREAAFKMAGVLDPLDATNGPGGI